MATSGSRMDGAWTFGSTGLRVANLSTHAHAKTVCVWVRERERERVTEVDVDVLSEQLILL